MVNQKRTMSESLGVEVVPIEMASLQLSATLTVAQGEAAQDPARSADTTSIPSSAVISSTTTAATTTTTMIETQDAAPIWSPNELYSAIVNDTFFAFLEAFNLQLSPPSGPIQYKTAADNLPTVIPINHYVDSHGKTLLHHACRFGKTQVIKALLYHAINALAECHIGRTAFHDAISSGKKEQTLEMAQLLHGHEPRAISVVDTNGSHILHLAAIHGCLEVIQWYGKLLLKDNGAPVMPAAACVPSSSSRATTVSLVPMSITSFSGRNLLHYAAYNGHLRVLQWVLSSENRWNSEFSASALDSNGYSLLHYAAMGGHMELCEWLVYHSSTRNDLNIIARNSGGQTAFDLAKTQEVKMFMAQVSQLPPAPTKVHCIGADSSSLGVAWDVELHADLLLREVLTPLWFELEFCKKPKGLTSASGLLSMVMMMSSSAPPFILKWEQVGVRMQPSAREYWLSGLERQTEYLVRMRAVNRNGGSSYSNPNLAFGEFTTAGSAGGAGGLKKQLLGLFPRSAGSFNSALQPSFIGTLHFELLEARHLHVALSRHEPSQHKAAADHGHFYSMVTMEIPEPSGTTVMPMSVATTPTARRRQTVPVTTLKKSGRSASGLPPPKCLYRVRTESASIQEEMVLAGSIHAFQHPAFHVATAFRVPEASSAVLTIEIRRKTYRVDSAVGVVRLSLMDFVRGLPAKLQWLSLGNASANATSHHRASTSSSSTLLSPRKTTEHEDSEPIRGEILIRTLFLADGITELPHPTRADVLSSSAQELLEDQVESSANYYFDEEQQDDEDDGDSDDSGGSLSHASSRPSLLAAASGNSTFDAMGFRIFDPRTLTTPAGGLTRRSSKVLSKSYQCYKLLHECVDRRQTQRWQSFHHRTHCDTTNQSKNGCSEHLGDHGTEFSVSTQQPLDKHRTCPYEARADPTLRLLVWHGVPASWRPAIYMRMSGALRMRASSPATYFQSLLQRTTAATSSCGRTSSSDSRSDDELPASPPPSSGLPESPQLVPVVPVCSNFERAEKQIQVDLQRTFAANQCWINSPQGQQSLARVLLAYAVHNQSLGYCQSMTFIVGRLLCLFKFHHEAQSPLSAQTPSVSREDDEATSAILEIEEQVFWLLAVFCEQFFPSYYTKGMAGLQVDGMVLEFLMRKRLPKVYRHLQQLQTPHIGLLLVTQWLLPVCCAVFPSETSFRMLDVLVFEGSSAVFALAIALLRVSQHDLLAETKDYMQLFRFLKDRDRRLYDTALLMEVAYEEHVLLEGEVEQLREQFRGQVEEHQQHSE